MNARLRTALRFWAPGAALLTATWFPAHSHALCLAVIAGWLLVFLGIWKFKLGNKSVTSP